MDSKTLNKDGVVVPDALISHVGARAGRFNLGFGLAGLAVCLLFSVSSATAIAFLLGIGLGIANQYLMLRILRSAMHRSPLEAKVRVTIRFYLRFAMLVTTMAALTIMGGVDPLGLGVGFGGTVVVTIVTMVFIAKGVFSEEAISAPTLTSAEG